MQNLFQELPALERRQHLADNCLKSEKQKVKRFFKKDELDALREDLSEQSIFTSELEDKLKELAAPIKAEIKKLKATLKSVMTLIKNKYEEKEEEVFLFEDHENSMMLYYSSDGELISSRKLMPHEKQTRIVELNKHA